MVRRSNFRLAVLEYFIEWLSNIPGGMAFGAVILLLLLCGLGLPLPEEFCILAVGYLAHLKVVSYKTGLFVTLVAIVVGDSMLFYIGRKLGHRIFESRFFKKLLTPERMKRVNDYFHRYGNWVVFVGRFLAGVRATTFVTAGILRMPFSKFIFFDALAALVSVPIPMYISYHFGADIEEALLEIHRTGRTLLLLALLIASGAIYLLWRRARIKAKSTQV